MSWQVYVDKNLAGFTQAAIIGAEAGELWAKSATFDVSPTELQVLAENFNSFEHFQKNGITLAGARYIFLSGHDRVLRGRKIKDGLHCMKTEQAILIGIFDTEHIMPQMAANQVEKLGDYLISQGY